MTDSPKTRLAPPIPPRLPGGALPWLVAAAFVLLAAWPVQAHAASVFNGFPLVDDVLCGFFAYSRTKLAPMIAGIGSEAFGLLVVLGVLALNLRSVPIALAVPPLFLFLRWVYRKDPVLLKAFLAYLKQADLYDPWVRLPVLAQRPEGFGRGLFC